MRITLQTTLTEEYGAALRPGLLKAVSVFIPNVSPTALQQRVQRAFFLLRTKAATFRSIPFGALNDRNRQGEVDYVPQPLPGIASSLTALGPSHGSRS
jgi:hypothetical protein